MGSRSKPRIEPGGTDWGGAEYTTSRRQYSAVPKYLVPFAACAQYTQVIGRDEPGIKTITVTASRNRLGENF